MNVVLYAALGVLLLAAIANWRRSAGLKRDLDRVTARLNDTQVFVNVAHERLKQEVLSQVQVALHRKGDGAAFHRDMSVGEVIKLHPQAASVMAGFHLGGCSSCSISDNHILGDAARDYGVNIDNLLTALNGLFDGTTKVPQDDPAGQILQVQPAE